jgi:hypothetical protein
MSDGYQNARGIKQRIRHLVLDYDMSYLETCETMKRQGYSITGITISAIRTEMNEILHLLIVAGVIDAKALAQHRKQIRARRGASPITIAGPSFLVRGHLKIRADAHTCSLVCKGGAAGDLEGFSPQKFDH